MLGLPASGRGRHHGFTRRRQQRFNYAILGAIGLAGLVLTLGVGLGWLHAGLAIALLAAAILAGALLVKHHNRDLDLVASEAARHARAQERALLRLRAPLRSRLIEGFADPLMMIDARRLVVEANAAAQRLFGPAIMGQDIFMTLRQPTVLETVKETLESGKPAEREILWNVPPPRHFVLRTAMIVNTLGDLEGEAGGDGETSPFHVVLVFSDITKVKLAEKMRVDFVANASHELRTPLTSLIGFIETLQGPARDDTAARKRFLAIMDEEARRMVRVVDDLLSLSQIERDKHIGPSGKVIVADLIAAVGGALAVALREDGRVLDIEVAKDLPPVRAERDQIIQVLQNLISNAIKYGHSGTPVRIAASQEATAAGKAMVRIAVSDKGPGIPPEHIPRLTERFYRVDTARSRRLGGTGLGLAIVKHIVERHRGTLAIKSTLGEGTTVAFTLPAMTGDASSPDHETVINP